MKILKNYIGKKICMELSGQIQAKGLLVDTGSDLIVLYNDKDFIYIPMVHIHYLYLDEDSEPIQIPDEMPLVKDSHPLSLRRIINNSKGLASEVIVANNQTIHGYVTNVMNDYFVFYSPVYQTIYVPLQHLKWLIPYQSEQVPYSLDKRTNVDYPSTLSLARSLDEQIKKLFGKIVIFDLGEDPRKVGKLLSFKNNMIELATARESITYVNARHIKTMHIPPYQEVISE